jgi:hypothetical protein
MIDDDAEYEQRRQIRAQADADVASFIASLDQDDGSGVPPPPTIKVTEVSSQPVKIDFLGWGPQDAQTSPAPFSPPSPPAPTGICCVGYDCSVTTEAECDGIWVGGPVCSDVQCCNPYFEVHVEVVVCGSEVDGSCIQTIDLIASVNVPSVVAADECCTLNLNGTGGAIDDNGNTISLGVTSSLGGASLSWFVNVTPNCPTSYGAASTGGVETTGDCIVGGTTVYPINNVFGGGSCDGHLYTAVGTITVTWHG